MNQTIPGTRHHFNKILCGYKSPSLAPTNDRANQRPSSTSSKEKDRQRDRERAVKRNSR